MAFRAGPVERSVKDAIHGEGDLVMNAAMSVATTPRMAAATAVISANFEIRKADLAMELASLEMDSAVDILGPAVG